MRLRATRLGAISFGEASGDVPLILDLLSASPASAYGFRKLRAGYTGNCCRVRRGLDNAELDIPFLAGVLDEATLTNFVGAGNIIKNSNAFSSSGWNNFGWSLTANTIANPIDSTVDGWTLGGDPLQGQSFRCEYARDKLTASIYVKYKNVVNCNLQLVPDGGGTAAQASFNTQTGAVNSTTLGTFTTISAGSVDAGSGWFRIYFTVTLPSANAGTVTLKIGSSNEIYIYASCVSCSELTTYIATDGSTAQGNGFLTTVYDQGLSGFDSVQTTAANQPYICTGGGLFRSNTKPCGMSFGSAWMKPVSNVVSSGNKTSVNMVLNSSDNDGRACGIWENSGGGSILYAPNIAHRVHWYDNNATVFRNSLLTNYVVPTVLGAQHINSITYNAGDFNCYLNGTNMRNGSLNSTDPGTGNFTLWSSAYNWNAPLSEQVNFLTELSSTDRLLLERDQGAFFGITVA